MVAFLHRLVMEPSYCYNMFRLTVLPPRQTLAPICPVGAWEYFKGKSSFKMIQGSGSKRRILIADDELEVGSVLFDLLSGNYECETVNSAEQALERLLVCNYDLVISDIMMKGMSGLELVPRVLALAPDTVVILISGMQTIESAIEALRVGAFDYIMKPFDLRHVEAAVERALEHRDLIVAKRHYENFLEKLVEERTAQLDRALVSLEESYRATLRALVMALEMRDSETRGHSERVVNFSLRLGRELGLSEEEMRALEFGALLHDIGKIGIPDAILRKPGQLTEEEWQRMREHPRLGQQMLSGIKFLEGAACVVGQHHERWDGSGYPLGLRGEEIDIKARIFAVADALDAMMSDRIYRKGRSYEWAASELCRHSGTQFDPKVIQAFLRIPREDWEELHKRSMRDFDWEQNFNERSPHDPSYV